MMPTFPYMAMTITGIFHIIFGFAIFINACVGFGIDAHSQYDYSFTNNDVYNREVRRSLSQVMNIYLGVVLGSSLWIMIVGILGILAGIKREKHQQTHSLKIAYMVTSILSAVLFSLAGVSLSAVLRGSSQSYGLIGLVGSIASFADFVLAIVSASICCCCANSTSNTPGVVFVQGQAPPPGNYPPGTYPPGTYPPGTYPPQNLPPGNYPGVVYPPGNYPPPAYPVSDPANFQAFNVIQSPQDGVVNPGYQLNPTPGDYPTKTEMA